MTAFQNLVAALLVPCNDIFGALGRDREREREKGREGENEWTQDAPKLPHDCEMFVQVKI